MITIDQARIDAPAFPRSADWWRRFLPGWMTVDVRADGLVVIDVTGVAHTSQGPKSPAVVRRIQEAAMVRWVRNLPRLAAGIIEQDEQRVTVRPWLILAACSDPFCEACLAMIATQEQAP